MASNIIFIGYRGCGKTTFGKLLADQVWKQFVDVDDETCKRFDSKTITQIWDEFGEPAWREAEVEVTRELVGKSEMIIGLGGGTLMQPGAREAVENAADAVRIYLKCDPQVLLGRIESDSRSADTRPSLTAHGGGIDEIKAVLEQREPVYEAVADHVFDVSLVDVEGGLRHLIKRCL
jgi:shikimate kinase